MQLAIVTKVGDLTHDQAAQLEQADTFAGHDKYEMKKPALLFIFFTLSLALLNLINIMLGVFFLLPGEKHEPGIGLMLLLIGLIMSAVFGFLGIRALRRRLNGRLYYVVFLDECLLERMGNCVTIIPTYNLLHAYEKHSIKGIYVSAVDYRDDLDAKCTYELKEWYKTKRNLPGDLAIPMQNKYNLKAPAEYIQTMEEEEAWQRGERLP